MLEFKLNQDLDQQVPQKIDFNYEELKAELSERLGHYRNLIVTEDGTKAAKEDRAKLNALKTAISQKRISIKKEYMKPYDLFEAQVKELTGLIDEPIKAIDSQLQAFEDKRIEEKRQTCQEAYSHIFDDEKALIFTFEKIMNPKWLNKTTTMASVIAELNDKKARIDADMLVLESVEDPWKSAAKNQYEATMDISKTMSWVNQQKKAEEARRQIEQMAAEARVRAAEQQVQATSQPEPEQRPEAPKTAPVEAKTEEKLYTLRLEFELTMEQATALKEFIKINNISYKKI